eukprot:TRINITY_DN170_c0_g1_i1.p1 TRINITY_DN170_c0_g1~~TRINITY_DN170_c0_g1_i1.p1  ORF type:complete len:416 (-),score=78.54 TRINITY_DN170_c0_g1_i1:764-2011(-)
MCCMVVFILYNICWQGVEQWPDFGCEGIKVQRAHQPTSQCQGNYSFFSSLSHCSCLYLQKFTEMAYNIKHQHNSRAFSGPSQSRGNVRICGAKAVKVQCSVEVKKIIKKEVAPLDLENIGLPMNTFNPKKPFTAKIKSVENIVGPKATGDVSHIIIETDGKIPFVEGQSYGVIPPGTKINKKGKEVPHGTRLYSIGSSRYGDLYDGNTTSLCVRRAVYWDPEMNAEDPAKMGICSNFLSDAQPGQEITMTGPTGKVLLMPEDPNATIICVATGTGIAPFRSFWRRIFFENIPDYKFTGLFWVFMGVANSDAKLYDEEMQEILATYPDQFRLDYALSREQKNKKGGKMYIQDKVEEYSTLVFDELAAGAHIYFCGLKGMMPGIQDMLQRVAEEKGLVFEDWLKNLKQNNQWHVEVY